MQWGSPAGSRQEGKDPVNAWGLPQSMGCGGHQEMRSGILPGSGWFRDKFRVALCGGRVVWACRTNQVPGMSGMAGCSA